jgi:hypothetical protein
MAFENKLKMTIEKAYTHHNLSMEMSNLNFEQASKIVLFVFNNLEEKGYDDKYFNIWFPKMFSHVVNMKTFTVPAEEIPNFVK